MRWPWQRKRDVPEADPPLRQSSVPPPSPAGWAFLPPLQRTTGRIPVLTDPDLFIPRIPSRMDPSFMGAMSHLVTDDASPGVIDIDGRGLDSVDMGNRSVEGRPPATMDLRQAPTARVQRSTRAAPAPVVASGDGPTAQRTPENDAGPAPSGEVPSPETQRVDLPADRSARDDIPEEDAPETSEPARASETFPPDTGSSEQRADTFPTEQAPGGKVADVPIVAPGAELPGPGTASSSEANLPDAHATYVPLPPPVPLQRVIAAPFQPPQPRPDLPSGRRPGLGRPFVPSRQSPAGTPGTPVQLTPAPRIESEQPGPTGSEDPSAPWPSPAPEAMVAPAPPPGSDGPGDVINAPADTDGTAAEQPEPVAPRPVAGPRDSEAVRERAGGSSPEGATAGDSTAGPSAAAAAARTVQRASSEGGPDGKPARGPLPAGPADAVGHRDAAPPDDSARPSGPMEGERPTPVAPEGGTGDTLSSIIGTPVLGLRQPASDSTRSLRVPGSGPADLPVAESWTPSGGLSETTLPLQRSASTSSPENTAAGSGQDAVVETDDSEVAAPRAEPVVHDDPVPDPVEVMTPPPVVTETLDPVTLTDPLAVEGVRSTIEPAHRAPPGNERAPAAGAAGVAPSVAGSVRPPSVQRSSSFPSEFPLNIPVTGSGADRAQVGAPTDVQRAGTLRDTVSVRVAPAATAASSPAVPRPHLGVPVGDQQGSGPALPQGPWPLQRSVPTIARTAQVAVMGSLLAPASPHVTIQRHSTQSRAADDLDLDGASSPSTTATKPPATVLTTATPAAPVMFAASPGRRSGLPLTTGPDVIQRWTSDGLPADAPAGPAPEHETRMDGMQGTGAAATPSAQRSTGVSSAETAPPVAETPPPVDPGVAAAALPAAASGLDPARLEDLAKRLFPLLVRRMKAEMLLDRERRGLRTDVN